LKQALDLQRLMISIAILRLQRRLLYFLLMSILVVITLKGSLYTRGIQQLIYLIDSAMSMDWMKTQERSLKNYFSHRYHLCLLRLKRNRNKIAMSTVVEEAKVTFDTHNLKALFDIPII
jgi:hypothetical protein